MGLQLSIIAILVGLALPTFAQVSTASATIWEVCLAQRGNSTENLAKPLVQARAPVFVQAYAFTSALIAKVLLEVYQEDSCRPPPRQRPTRRKILIR